MTTWDGMQLGLIGLGIALLLLAVVAWLRSRELWQQAGLPAGEVIFSDTGNWYKQAKPLYSAQFQLTGKPDYLIQQANGLIIPVEVKSRSAPSQPNEGHVFQLAAYCLLVEEVYGIRPDHGIIQYNDRAYSVRYSEEIEEQLLETLAAMREDLFAEELDRSHEERRRCRRCPYRAYCDQRLS